MKKEQLLEELFKMPHAIKNLLYALELGEYSNKDYLNGKTVQVRKVPGRNNVTYAIYKGSTVFSKITGSFYWEPSPSSRDDEFFQEFRFASMEEAIESYFCFHKED